MKALSIQQPWAFLISTSVKDIENRTWPTHYRGRLYIHTGKKPDLLAIPSLEDKGFSFPQALALQSDFIFLGGIIGEVDIIDCVTHHPSHWFTGPYGFVLANPTLYHIPIPCLGRLGIFTPLPPPQAVV